MASCVGSMSSSVTNKRWRSTELSMVSVVFLNPQHSINLYPTEITSRRRPLRDRRPEPIVDDMPESPTVDSPNANTTFPPPPNMTLSPLSSSPSSASPRGSNPLTRALSMATGILRGSRRRSSSYQHEYAAASPRRTQTFGAGRGQGLGLELQGARDAEEDELLTSLEELAQKTEVLTHWADEMYDYVKAFPQSKYNSGETGPVLTVASIEPLPDPKQFSRREGETERLAARRKNADIQAEYNAMTCVALYMLLMSFSQKGIDKLRNYHEHLQMRDPDGELEVSEGFDEGELPSVLLYRYVYVSPCRMNAQRCHGLRTTLSSVTIGLRWSRHGCLLNTWGPRRS